MVRLDTLCFACFAKTIAQARQLVTVILLSITTGPITPFGLSHNNGQATMFADDAELPL
jgi:hypothetical protein